MRQVKSQIDIDAPRERVWAVLSRTDAFPEWNPFIRSLVGDLRREAKIRVTVQPPGKRPMTYSSRVSAANAPQELRWVGRAGLPGLFDVDHAFRLEALGASRTRVVEDETFRGILVWMMGQGLLRDAKAGFEAQLAALKRRAEAPAAKAAPEPTARRG